MGLRKSPSPVLSPGKAQAVRLAVNNSSSLGHVSPASLLQPCCGLKAKVGIAPCSSSVSKGLWLFDKAWADNVLSTSTEQREAEAATSVAMHPVVSQAQGNSTLIARFPRSTLGNTLSGRSTCPGGKPRVENSEVPGSAPVARQNICSLCPSSSNSVHFDGHCWKQLLCPCGHRTHAIAIMHQHWPWELLWLWSCRERKPVVPTLYALHVWFDSGLSDNGSNQLSSLTGLTTGLIISILILSTKMRAVFIMQR